MQDDRYVSEISWQYQGVTMAIKRTTTPQKKTATTPVKAVPGNSDSSQSELVKIQEIIALQTKHLEKLDAMVSSLGSELSDIKSLIAQSAPETRKAPVKTPAPKSAKTPVKSVAVANPEKRALVSVKKPATTPSTPAPAKKAPVKAAGASKVRSDVPVTIPKDIADRINALTSKKVINQNQLATDVELPQNVIYEISKRKLTRISPISIEKIQAALKSYESKKV